VPALLLFSPPPRDRFGLSGRQSAKGSSKPIVSPPQLDYDDVVSDPYRAPAFTIITRAQERHAMPELSSAEQKFILHWGEMGARWGISRTVAQIHALLYLSPKPLTAEEIATTLSVARSNVSTSLKELQSWGLVSVGHVLGDRKDRYESMQDVWELFKVILDGRKRREVDPTLAVLRQCAGELEASDSADVFTKQRLQEMLEFFEIVTKSYEQVRDMPKEELLKVLKLGDKLRKLFGM
jgi:DNA-binding transcriptional regulator GbsR (MarR family)